MLDLALRIPNMAADRMLIVDMGGAKGAPRDGLLVISRRLNDETQASEPRLVASHPFRLSRPSQLQPCSQATVGGSTIRTASAIFQNIMSIDILYNDDNLGICGNERRAFLLATRNARSFLVSITQLTPAGKSVDIWYTVCPVPSAASIAIGKGDLQKTFANTGVNLRSLRTHEELKVREAHYDQTQESLFREGGNIPPLWARADGRNLRLIGLTWIETYSAVLTLPESNIRTPADLKGKRLAIINRPNETIDYARATALRGYLSALKHGGLRREDVTFVDIDIQERHVGNQPKPGVLSSSAFSVSHMRKQDGLFVKALLQGHVDALHVHGSRGDIRALLNAHVVFDATSSPDLYDHVNNSAPVAFTVRGELLDSHPDIVTAYIAQNIRTARWAKRHPREAERYIARDSGLPEETVQSAYSPQVAASLEPSLDSKLVSYLENQKNFLLEEGFIKKDFAIEEFIAREPLEAARKIVDAEDAAGARELDANAA